MSKRKKIMVASAVALATVAVTFGLHSNSTEPSGLSLRDANLEALTQDEYTPSAEWSASTFECGISVQANGNIKLLELFGLSAEGNGNIVITGGVRCVAGGTSTCKPVECIDIYKVLKGL